VIRAAAQLVEQNICRPILLGLPERIDGIVEDLGLDFEYTVINPREDPRRKSTYAVDLAKRRARKGMTLADAERLLKSRPYFGSQMLASGDADGMVGGVGRTYSDVLRPVIQTIGTHPDAHCIVGCYVVSVAGRLIVLADATVNIYPDQRTLAEIAVQASRVARRLGLLPRVAMLSFSNFGTNREQRSHRIEDAVATARELDPTLLIDGPMQADTALDTDVQAEYPFLAFDGPANVLVCPNLASANIAYKLLEQLADAEMIGPVLEGTTFPVQIAARSDDVRDIVNMATLCVADACRGDSYWESFRSTDGS
jgi:malate dehydrogenase (oxaloacetate-decarboxylating)(NADP+)